MNWLFAPIQSTVIPFSPLRLFMHPFLTHHLVHLVKLRFDAQQLPKLCAEKTLGCASNPAHLLASGKNL